MSRAPVTAARLKAVGAVAFVAVLLLLFLLTRFLPETPETASPAASSSATRAVQTPTTKPAPTSRSSGSVDPESGLAYVELADLPSQARTVVALIEAGGPFPYAKDGSTFRNSERVLPAKASGYYREYTVRTPGESDRGARRIVTGDRDRQLFYTGDHYASFARIRP